MSDNGSSGSGENLEIPPVGVLVSTNGAAGDTPPASDNDGTGAGARTAAAPDHGDAGAMDIDVEEEKEQVSTPASSTSSPSSASRRHPSSHLDSTIAGLQRYVDSEFAKIDNGRMPTNSRKVTFVLVLECSGITS